MGDKKTISRMLGAYLEIMNKKAIFIKQHDVKEISLEQICREKLVSEDVIIFCYEYELYTMKAAFEPFMMWIRQTYYSDYVDRYSVEEFIENCGVYSLQREVFTSYIKDGICTRTLEVMMNEYQYEEQCVYESVYSAIKYISQNKKVLFVISRIHMAPLCVLKLINMIFDWEDNVKYIFTYAESFLVNELCSNEWNLLMQKAEERKMLLIADNKEIVTTQDYPDKFCFEENDIDRYIKLLNNMVHLFAFEDAKYYLDIVISYCYRVDSNVSDEDKFKALELMGMVYLGLGDYKDALLLCEKMVPLFYNHSNLYREYIYNYFSAKAHLIMSEAKLTHKFCKSAKKIAKKMSDEYMLMNTEIIETIVEFGSLKELFRCNYSYQIKESVLDRAKKIGHENFLAYMYVFGFENDPNIVHAIGNGQRESVFFTKGIEIAKRLGNKNLLLNAYMKNIILYSDCGCYRYVRQMYEKRAKYIDKDKPVRLAHLYAGFGYNEIVLEDYAKADEYFQKSVQILIEHKEAEDIAEVLYNISINYYMMGQYYKTIDCIELILKTMKIIHIQGLKICNTSKFYGLLALSYYRLGQYIECYYCIDKMEMILSYVMNKTQESDQELWIEDLFLYHLCKANLFCYENDEENAKMHFDMAYRYMQINDGKKYYSHYEYAFFKAAFLEKYGLCEQRDTVLKEEYDYCVNNDMPYKAKQLKDLLDNNGDKNQPSYELPDLPVQNILDVAEYVGAKIELQKRKKDIEFMTICHNIMGNEDSNVCTVVNQTMNLIRNSFSLDRVIFIEKKEKRASSTFTSENTNIDRKDVKQIIEFFEDYKLEFMVNRFDKNFQRFNKITEKIGGDEVATIIGIPVYGEGVLKRIFIATIDAHKNYTENRKLLDSSNLEVIKCAISQLDEEIGRINNNLVIRIMNAKLEKAAYIDQLTGIYNRMGFQKILGEEISDTGVVLYMDLDDFKKYNDTYGHNIGDEILKLFAGIIKDNVGKFGYAVRYGGDEFVVIIPKENEAFAEQLALKIQLQLKENASYSTHIEGLKFTSSVGIAQYDSAAPVDFEIALKKADRALYYVKDSQKGNIAIWSKIEDKIN